MEWSYFELIVGWLNMSGSWKGNPSGGKLKIWLLGCPVLLLWNRSVIWFHGGLFGFMCWLYYFMGTVYNSPYLLNGSGSGSCWRKDFVEVEILSRESWICFRIHRHVYDRTVCRCLLSLVVVVVVVVVSSSCVSSWLVASSELPDSFSLSWSDQEH